MKEKQKSPFRLFLVSVEGHIGGTASFLPPVALLGYVAIPKSCFYRGKGHIQ